jgi:hypothetical protein
MREYAVVNALSLASDLSDSSHFTNSGQPAVAVVVDRSHIRKSPAELRFHEQHSSAFLAKFDTEFYSDFGRVPDPPLVWWSQWLDATLSLNPPGIENKSQNRWLLSVAKLLILPLIFGGERRV